MKRSIIIIICLLNLSVLFSQQSKIDSLIQVAHNTTNDSIRVRTYLKIYYQYHRTDLYLAKDYVLKAETLALERGLNEGLGLSKYRKGSLYRSMNEFQLAEKAFNEGISIFNELNDSINLAAIKIELGRLLQLQARSDEAILMYMEALPIFKSSGDKNSEARTHNYLGSLYKALSQYEKAIEHYERALMLVREINFKPGISACLSNLGTIYIKLDKFDKAESLLKEALTLKNEANDQLGASRVLLNLGSMYSDKLDFDLSNFYYQKAYDIVKTIDSKGEMLTIEYGLAKNSYHSKDYKNAVLYGLAILNNEAVSNDVEFHNETANLLSESYKGLNDYENAYTYSKLHQRLSDSIYNQNIVLITNDLEAKYKNKENAQENKLLTTQNKLQTLQIEKTDNRNKIILLLAILMFIIAGMLYYLYLMKQKSNQKLKELNNLKSNFFANISHEFRTPLTLIKGPIEQLQKYPEEKLNAENINMMHRNTNRLLNLVNQLLDLSKVDENKLNLSLAEGDILKCLRETTTSFNSRAAQNEIDYVVSIPNEILWTSFDRDILEKIVYNLLSNAFKFSNNKSRIAFIVTYASDQINLKISDQGEGISKDSLPFIFDRFYQAQSNDTRTYEGTGIGLSLVKELIELMQGSIDVSSELGQGTTFNIMLPCLKIKTKSQYVKDFEKPIVTKINNAQLKKESNTIDIRNVPTILLVEDNLDMRNYIKNQLITNYKINEAENGEIGLKKAIASPPDLIITDVMMPKMEGMEFCEKLKTNINTSHVPIIMLTAKAGLNNKLSGLEIGADDYLTKPFNKEELEIRIKNLIAQREKLRALYRKQSYKIDPSTITNTSIDERFLISVIDLLEEKFSETNFGVPQMQKSLGMSKTQLHRKLKVLTDESPGELIRNFRLKRAKLLMSQNADNISQIAYDVGFNSVSYFTKCFKHYFGETPSTYIKSL